MNNFVKLMILANSFLCSVMLVAAKPQLKPDGPSRATPKTELALEKPQASISYTFKDGVLTIDLGERYYGPNIKDSQLKTVYVPEAILRAELTRIHRERDPKGSSGYDRDTELHYWLEDQFYGITDIVVKLARDNFYYFKRGPLIEGLDEILVSVRIETPYTRKMKEMADGY